MTNHIQLNIDSQESTLSSTSQTFTLPIGENNFNGFTFQHSPITPYEAEMAIEHIENVIIPVRKKILIENIVLSSDNEKLKILWEHIGTAENFLATTQIEEAFNELVNIINGSPISSTNLPSDKSFTAFLLIIREFTHHWGLTGIYIN